MDKGQWWWLVVGGEVGVGGEDQGGVASSVRATSGLGNGKCGYAIAFTYTPVLLTLTVHAPRTFSVSVYVCAWSGTGPETTAKVWVRAGGAGSTFGIVVEL